MGKIIDLTGKKFNRLKVISFDRLDREKGLSFWNCICDCGNELVRAGTHIKKGVVKSCGCLALEKSKENIKGVKSKRKRIYLNEKLHPAYVTFNGMVQRCSNPRCKEFRWYGAKGIKIHEEWLKNQTSFVEWAIDNGFEKGLCIDRKDPSKDYTPDNCQFITKEENLKKVRIDNLKKGYKYSRGRVPVMEGVME